MKKLLISIVALLVLIPLSVYAAETLTLTPNDSELNFVEGGSREITINGENIMGKIEFTSSDEEVVTVKAKAATGDDEDDLLAGAVWVDSNKRVLIIEAKKEGTATIILTGTNLSYEDDLIQYTKEIQINVIKDTGNTNTTTNNTATNTNTTDGKANPKTGVFLDATIIIIGIGVVAGAAYYVNKKRTMI